MADTPFLLLSQNDCPRCDRLKAMLEQPLKNHFKDVITVVHRQAQPELFRQLAEWYGVFSTPVVIRRTTNELLTDVNSLMTVVRFLEARPVEAAKGT